MKYYSTSILLLFFIILLNSDSFSQTKLRLQLATAIPTGYAEDAVSLGYGGSINISSPIFISNIELSVTAGYYQFGFKENLPDYDFNFTSIPIIAGVRFNFTDVDVIPYIGLESGVYITEYLTKISFGFFGDTSTVTNAIHWGISPEAGFKINIIPELDLDVKAKYNYIRTVYIARAYLLIETGFTIKF